MHFIGDGKLVEALAVAAPEIAFEVLALQIVLARQHIKSLTRVPSSGAALRANSQ
jgi:hypothetical protein